MLPHLKKLPGKKMLVGDNLSSHISSSVIQACMANQIEFVCLPPNSTDKLQPLDVSVFGPLKAAWRVILTEYKGHNPSQVGINMDFPRLLATLLERTNPAQYMPAAFDRCGLYPVNVARAVERIPHRSMESSVLARELLNSTLGEKLDQLHRTDKAKSKKRGKKIHVPAGKSYTSMLEDQEVEEDEEEQETGKASENREDEDEEDVDDPSERMIGRKKGRSAVVSSSESEAELPDPDDHVEDEDEGQEDGNGAVCQKKPPAFTVGTFVVAVYNKQWYLAQVEEEPPENECEGFTLLKYMERRGHNQFVWGKVNDILKTINRDILLKVDPPIPISLRFWGLPKETVKKVEKLFVVRWSIICIYVSFTIQKYKKNRVTK
jgi:hypothetical protein